MQSLLVALVIVVLVGGVAWLVRRRQAVDVPTQKEFTAPTQIDRNDFEDVDREWLVAVFTSATCHVCADMLAKAEVVASRHVAVVDVEFTAAKALHEKYRIEAVPTIVICDSAGVVRRSFMGPASATDLWAAVADARDPRDPA